MSKSKSADQPDAAVRPTFLSKDEWPAFLADLLDEVYGRVMANLSEIKALLASREGYRLPKPKETIRQAWCRIKEIAPDTADLSDAKIEESLWRKTVSTAVVSLLRYCDEHFDSSDLKRDDGDERAVQTQDSLHRRPDTELYTLDQILNGFNVYTCFGEHESAQELGLNQLAFDRFLRILVQTILTSPLFEQVMYFQSRLRTGGLYIGADDSCQMRGFLALPHQAGLMVIRFRQFEPPSKDKKDK